MFNSLPRFLFFFAASFLVGFVATYVIIDKNHLTGTAAEVSQAAEPAAQANASEPADGGQDAKLSNVKPGGEIFVNRGCIQCHSIDAYNIQAGKVGPDLSIAYTDVPSKFGKPLEDFLKAPSSAVMSSVIGAKPLTDDELQKVVAALKAVAEQK